MQKLGGTSLATSDLRRKVARIIDDILQAGVSGGSGCISLKHLEAGKVVVVAGFQGVKAIKAFHDNI